MRHSFAVALLLSSYAPAQVSVVEPTTRAELVDGHTTISVALKNATSKTLDVRIRLRWLSPNGVVDGETSRNATLPSGASTLSIPHPLREKRDPLVERLQYDLYPAERNYTAFGPISGMLNFLEIADYAFTFGVLTAGIPRPGQPFEVRVLTAHPITGKPVPGVAVKAEGEAATTDHEGIAVLRIQREPDDDGPIDVAARIGDFASTGESTPLPNSQDTVRAYTDKPIYQPGQTMHVRILAVGASGKVKAGEEYEIRIVDESDDLVHSAKVSTSRFGVASTDWQIPEAADSGRYTIRLKTEDTGRYFLRSVNVRRYELPSFRVTAIPDHPFYLSGQKAQVEIRGEYLFGKPVAAGKVRITAADDEKKNVAEGVLDATGRFRAPLDTSADFNEYAKFKDRHFIAFLTDPSTNRTEQRKFNIRISRDPVHIYAVHMENNHAGRRLYVTTYSPDGTPLRSSVDVANGDTVLGKGTTNRFGLARIDLPASDENTEELEIRVLTAGGLRAKMELSFDKRQSDTWLQTDRSLYRMGDGVRCAIESVKPDLHVLLIASNEKDQVVFTKTLLLRGGRADVEIPYDKRFGRALNIGVASGSEGAIASRRVYYPGPGELVVAAAAEKSTYRPGETATIRFQASAEAALGIAVVDQSVLERAATDSAFGRRGWFEDDYGREPNLGGITERDLFTLSPTKIDDDIQLVAEVMAPEFGPFFNNTGDPLAEARRTFAAVGAKALAPVLGALDQHYLRTLEYPRDEASFQRIAGSVFGRVQDPWLRPFVTRFSIERQYSVLSIASAGPDKRLGTADDFTALTVRRRWFAEYESLVRGVLSRCTDYPASSEEFVSILDAAGIRFTALRDPWGSALRVRIAYSQRLRKMKILSAGPDRVFDTADDFVVAEFGGPYFSATESRVDKILNAAPDFPATSEGFRALLSDSGVNVDSLRDPWGRPYYVALRDDESFTDQVQLYTYAEYNDVSEDRKQVKPVKQTMRIAEIRSVGKDGLKGTHDDFAVATFQRVLRTPQASEQLKIAESTVSPASTLGGTGTLLGKVTDATGAVVTGVEVKLNDVYVTRTGETGRFFFRGLRAGKYRLSCQAPGFRANVLEAIPVAADQITRANMVLQVGAVSETVTVEAEVAALNTESASVAMAAAVTLSTPRVREYFPETLYWQPELVTDGEGRASVRLKLADSVTTWHVAVIGSTADGRIAEGSAEIRAFQPFLVDLDVPSVLTIGDEVSLPVPVRNYLERSQKVAVTAKVPPELGLAQAVRQPGVVAPSSSSNAVLTLRAESAIKSGRVRVTAVGGSASDAIEKPVAIHPDGERRVLAVNSVVESGHEVPLVIGSNAIAGSIQGSVKIYPSLLARILESIEVVLERPHGCGEQMISSTYPNLLLLKALNEAGLVDEPLNARAKKNLLAGYHRLLRYQDYNGGFTYWGHGDTDVALTAYALTFLDDAKAFIAVDEDRVSNARRWLAKQSASETAANALRMRALAQAQKGDADLDRQLGDMARKAAEFGDPYAMAAYVLAALEANKPELADPIVEQLGRLARDERGAAFWALRANTPYHGWGRSGQVETTAMVVSAMARWRKYGRGNEALNVLIDRGALFLLQNADAGGAWATSQATVTALTALLDTWSHDDGARAVEVDVRVNGVSGGKMLLPAGRTARAPLVLDISRFLRAGANEIALTGFGPRAQQVQVAATWYETWGRKRQAKDMDMRVHYNVLAAAVNDPVACDVVISRPSFRGYGMMIATVGLPPGAEVDRGVLETLVRDGTNGVNSYEVEPGHVAFYVWPRAADVKFRFVFRPRYALKARAAQSVLYDYYNPDERVVIEPPRFVVGQ
ncbi:MAG: carboxypeptidase regulatory-like domain-containing protein [Bryobacterales bacterium]|nr:carboxypeptidase regulatory-like domain-containing protein [Bryobacterales bacterium]